MRDSASTGIEGRYRPTMDRGNDGTIFVIVGLGGVAAFLVASMVMGAPAVVAGCSRF